MGTTYTKGLLGFDQKQIVEEQIVDGQRERAAWTARIENESYDAILADEGLMRIVRSTGRQLFGDNCAACHGSDGRGRANYPDLTDDDWLWGGGPELIEQTMRVGINTQHPDSRIAQMPSFGRDEMLEREQVRSVAAYVYSLTNPDYSTPEALERITAGKEVFATTCAACHGEDAKGNRDVGAPNLTDAYWVYGGDMQTIIASVHGGRQGHMPTWDERLTGAEIRMLSLYVHDLGTRQP
ncbi:Cbb3-type cytochrome c oxidase subunit [Mesorhizobium tianshanense]|uniref:Cytochrome c oxidase cbb3-type subunit 3 n=1 Tax=Mesorhizobium tianshanense TaxID=39844 RepID=A0A562MW30_9HYPH|nr:cytochrome c oxidase cbb3-type subunit 3 [Mesorhizobium tianshanense]GLS41735.1 Cbb3-type cytochrome c oxidase subunit [Mesorhizobium tianshanense]